MIEFSGFKKETDDIKVPSYCILLTEEQAKEIEGKIAEFYNVNGKTLFEVREKGKKIGYAMYVVWK